jgi:HD-GYP domain-containing protein (c-di-GMP phosphodiesterase class II)
VIDSQILFLADFIERHIDRKTYILQQKDALGDAVKSISGVQISREVIELFFDASHREEFWLDLTSPRLYALLFRYGPFQSISIDIDNIIAFARLLGMIVDFKSPFTATHSSGVAHCSMHLAQMVGMSETEIQLIESAGLLHDLGKLVIPNTILDKPAALTDTEFAVIKQHPYHTFSILNSISGLKPIAEWASFHHERLDGSGYPFHKQAHEINMGARIIAVSDIFTALIEDRPYRKGMDASTIKKILLDLSASSSQDDRLVHLLLDGMEDIRKAVKERQVQARDFYQTKIERLAP